MSTPVEDQLAKSASRPDFSLRNLLILAGLSIAAILVMGYHPGLEDDSFYLAAIKKHLNPALFPHDADFFRVQFQATIFDNLVAFSANLIRVPLAWTIFLWQFAAVFLLLLGCYRLSRRCFTRPEASWAAVSIVGVLLSMPLPGIAILLGDQYLHPRTLASAAILAAIVAVIDRKWWLSGIFLAIAFSIHAIAACFGISFCLFLAWNLRRDGRENPALATVMMLLPLGWLFEPASDAWRKAASTRGFYFLGSWRWYEWLGVIAPLALVFLLQRLRQRRTLKAAEPALSPVAYSLLYFGIFQMLAGIAIMLPPSLERLRPFEPMRYLHLLYLLFFVIAGGLAGAYLLDRRAYRWLLLFVPLTAGMFYDQRQMYSASPHLELSSVSTGTGWLGAFRWIRLHTPVDAYFAVDPHYETLPGEDYHGFRALAERSVLADYEKDAGMAARVPSLAPRWLKQVSALDGWRTFHAADFERLKRDFGVDWVVLSRTDSQFSNADTAFMICPYANEDVKVCRLQ
jgi:hypothetical protein